MNGIAATVIIERAPTWHLRSSVTAHAMMNETENREFSLPAITLGLVLFFGSVSLSISYFAVRTGLLPQNVPAQTALAALRSD